MSLFWAIRPEPSLSNSESRGRSSRGFDAIVENKDRFLSMMRMVILTQMKPLDCMADPEKAYLEFERRLSPPADPKKRKLFVDS
jgi:hypothetical protein